MRAEFESELQQARGEMQRAQDALQGVHHCHTWAAGCRHSPVPQNCAMSLRPGLFIFSCSFFFFERTYGQKAVDKPHMVDFVTYCSLKAGCKLICMAAHLRAVRGQGAAPSNLI